MSERFTSVGMISRTSPSPGGILHNTGCYVASNERVDYKRRGYHRRNKTSPFQRRDVCDDNLCEEL